MEIDELRKNFSLLKRIINPVDSTAERVDLSTLKGLIFEQLPKALKDNAPANFPELYFDFKQEYERFKEFILYEKLIGKNVVALGGGFSSGKSSFLNCLLDQKVLPANINPSTSVPAYLVHGETPSVYGINEFGSRVDMELDEVKAISHGFGKTEGESEATLGHILKSIFISSPGQRFENIALLDTPGYSKAESSDYSAKTDEKIARAQLNSSNYILWFVQADAGTITEEDIKFINSLNKDIPRLIIVNKADKRPPEEIAAVVAKIKEVLDIKGFPYVDVLTFSRKKDFKDDRQKIYAQLDEWNKAVYESRFAYNFKVLFTKCKEFYDESIDEESKRLNRLNKAVTLSTDDTVTECLTSLLSEIKRSITDLKDRKESLKQLRNEFFSEIKRVGDAVNITMPEPSEIDLIRDKAVDPKSVLDEYCRKNGVKPNADLAISLANIFADIKPVYEGVRKVREIDRELSKSVYDAINIDVSDIRFDFSFDEVGEKAGSISTAVKNLKVNTKGVNL